MDRVEEYREIVRQYLTDFLPYDPNAQLIVDSDLDRYLVLHNEWRNEDRIYGCAIHLDIIEGSIWIQQNNTEIYIDQELSERGVSPQDIILGFRSPTVRKLLQLRQNQRLIEVN